jgi:streptogramin lyase
MNLFSLLSLTLILASGSKAHTCGISYDIPLGDFANPSSVTFSPDQSVLLASGSGGITVFNVENGALTNGTLYDPCGGCTFDKAAFASNNLVFIPSNAGLYAYDIAGTTLSNPVINSVGEGVVAFTSNGAYFVRLTPTGGIPPYTITLYTISGTTLSSGTAYDLPTGVGPSQLAAFTPDGLYLAVGSGVTNNVVLYSVSGATLNGGTLYPLSITPCALAFSSNGLYLAVANCPSNTIASYLLNGGTLSASTTYTLPSGSSQPFDVTFSPDGSHFVSANDGSGDITVFTLGNLQNSVSYPLPQNSDGSTPSPTTAAFSSDGMYLATASGDGVLTIFNTGSWCSNDTSPSGSTTTASTISTSAASSLKNSKLTLAFALLSLYAANRN